MVKDENFEYEPDQIIKLDVSSLQKGNYVLTLRGDGINQVHHVIIE